MKTLLTTLLILGFGLIMHQSHAQSKMEFKDKKIIEGRKHVTFKVKGVNTEKKAAELESRLLKYEKVYEVKVSADGKVKAVFHPSFRPLDVRRSLYYLKIDFDYETIEKVE